MRLELRAIRLLHTWDTFAHVARSLGTSAHCFLRDLWTQARRHSPSFLRLKAAEPRESQVFEVSQTNAAALKNYRPANGIPCGITFFATAELKSFYVSDPIASWNCLTTAGMDIVALSENPASAAEDLHGRAVASRLQLCVDDWIAKRGVRSGKEVFAGRG